MILGRQATDINQRYYVSMVRTSRSDKVSNIGLFVCLLYTIPGEHEGTLPRLAKGYIYTMYMRSKITPYAVFSSLLSILHL